MKSFLKIVFVLTLIFIGYCWYAYPEKTKNYAEYGINTIAEYVSGGVKSYCQRECTASESYDKHYKYMTNLYEVKYYIIEGGVKYPVNVKTYGRPNLIKVGDRQTIVYDLPNGGRYKLSVRSGARIYIKSVEKIV